MFRSRIDSRSEAPQATAASSNDPIGSIHIFLAVGVIFLLVDIWMEALTGHSVSEAIIRVFLPAIQGVL